MHNLYLKKKQKYNWIKITICILLAVLIIWLWFFLSSKSASYSKQLQEQSNAITSEIQKNYQNILKNSEKDALSLGLTAESLINKGYTDLGLLTLEEANERGSYRDLCLYTASVYFSQNNISNALKYAETAKQLDPIHPPTYELLTEIYTARGDAKNAEICYNKANEFKGEK